MKNSSFKLLRRLFQKDKPNLLGRWGSINPKRKSELSNRVHCRTCPTKLVESYKHVDDVPRQSWNQDNLHIL